MYVYETFKTALLLQKYKIGGLHMDVQPLPGRAMRVRQKQVTQKNAPRQLLLHCSNTCIHAGVHFLHTSHDVHGCTNAAMAGCH